MASKTEKGGKGSDDTPTAADMDHGNIKLPSMSSVMRIAYRWSSGWKLMHQRARVLR
jgi:hypothetical protein